MIPLSDTRLPDFEAWLQARWSDRSWFTARGSLACSFGLLALRWVEVARMRAEDLQVDECRLYVRTAKGGPPRTILVPDGLLPAALAMRADVAGRADRMFLRRTGRVMTYQDIRRFVTKATLAVFPRRYTFHCFRHTAAMRCYERTGDVLAVQRLLGHASLQWTQTYLARLQAVDLGGPVAFAGGGTARAPKLFDPDGLLAENVATVRAVGPKRGKDAAAGDDRPAHPAEEFLERGEAALDKLAGEMSEVVQGADDDLAQQVRDAMTEPAAGYDHAHVCTENLMPIKWRGGPGFVHGKCSVCGSVWRWPSGGSIEAAYEVKREPPPVPDPGLAGAREAAARKACNHGARNFERRQTARGVALYCLDCQRFYAIETPQQPKARKRRKAKAQSGQGWLF